MARPVPKSMLDLYRSEVEELTDAHAPFGEVEDAIHAAELGWDEKTALWLLAWSRLDPPAQRHHAEATLAFLGAR
ncbi:MAG: hypothetical protein QOD66_199 [Solirubrobacteraceae bacterium]|nr:hypothetical protein [Solirubrobacteraceae bacterium]